MTKQEHINDLQMQVNQLKSENNSLQFTTTEAREKMAQAEQMANALADDNNRLSGQVAGLEAALESNGACIFELTNSLDKARAACRVAVQTGLAAIEKGTEVEASYRNAKAEVAMVASYSAGLIDAIRAANNQPIGGDDAQG